MFQVTTKLLRDSFTDVETKAVATIVLVITFFVLRFEERLEKLSLVFWHDTHALIRHFDLVFVQGWIYLNFYDINSDRIMSL